MVVQGVEPPHNIAGVPGDRLPSSGATGGLGLAACRCSGLPHYSSYGQNYRTYGLPRLAVSEACAAGFNTPSAVAGMSIIPEPSLVG